MDISENVTISPVPNPSSLPPRPPSSSPESAAGKDRLHITAGGRDGRALKKQLAIALGLRKAGSSASNSQSEGEDSIYGLLEMMKRSRHSRVTTGKMQLPDIGRLVGNNPGSTTTTRKITRKTRTIKTRSGIEDSDEDYDDDIDVKLSSNRLQEKSSHLTTSTHSKSINEKSKKSKKANKKEGSNIDEVSEEIFSSFGESSEGAAVVSAFSGDTTGTGSRLLRAKPPQARARHGRTSTNKSRPQQSSRGMNSENKPYLDKTVDQHRASNSSKDITDDSSTKYDDLIRPSNAIGLESTPVYMDSFQGWQLSDHESKTHETRLSENVGSDATIEAKRVLVDNSRTEKTQKSQIPRLVTNQKSGARMRNILNTVTTDNESRTKITSSREAERENVRNQAQSSNFSMNLGKLFQKSSKKSSSSTNEGINMQVTSRQSNTIDFDYDSLERELAKLKHSMYQTLEDFQDMKKETFRLKQEVRDMRGAQ